MRILVLTQHFAPEENAPAFRWTWLAEGFADRGATVDVITAAWSGANDAHAPEGNLHVHRVGNVLKGLSLSRRLINELLVSLKSFAKAVTLPRPDVVVITAPPIGAMLYALPLVAILRRPLVLELRDMWPELFDEYRTWSDTGEGPTASRAKELLTAAAIRFLRPIMLATRRKADLLVTTSESFAALEKSTGRSRVVCVRNGAEDRLPAARRDFDGTLHVLYLGNLGRAQYLATAVRAAALVKEAGFSIQLRLVGHGAHEEALRRLIARKNAPAEILAPIPRADIDEQYEWADTVLVMLRDWEAMKCTVPSKLYEALRIGKHISGSISGETADLIAQANAGDVVAPQDPEALAELWIRLCTAPDLLHRESDASAIIAATNLDSLADRYLDALEDLAAT